MTRSIAEQLGAGMTGRVTGIRPDGGGDAGDQPGCGAGATAGGTVAHLDGAVERGGVCTRCADRRCGDGLSEGDCAECGGGFGVDPGVRRRWHGAWCRAGDGPHGCRAGSGAAGDGQRAGSQPAAAHGAGGGAGAAAEVPADDAFHWGRQRLRDGSCFFTVMAGCGPDGAAGA